MRPIIPSEIELRNFKSEKELPVARKRNIDIDSVRWSRFLFKSFSCALSSIRKKFQKLFGERNVSPLRRFLCVNSCLFFNYFFIQRHFTVSFFLFFFIACATTVTMKQSFVRLKKQKKKSPNQTRPKKIF